MNIGYIDGYRLVAIGSPWLIISEDRDISVNPGIFLVELGKKFLGHTVFHLTTRPIPSRKVFYGLPKEVGGPVRMASVSLPWSLVLPFSLLRSLSHVFRLLIY